jgi:hypothetical protein
MFFPLIHFVLFVSFVLLWSYSAVSASTET